MTTPGRAVSEADIITLAGISGDWNPLHIDEEFSKNAGYCGRIAHGPMSMSMALGLMAQQNLIDGTALALLGLHRLRQRHRAAEIGLRISRLGCRAPSCRASASAVRRGARGTRYRTRRSRRGTRSSVKRPAIM
jgi:hypothetical protein